MSKKINFYRSLSIVFCFFSTAASAEQKFARSCGQLELIYEQIVLKEENGLLTNLRMPSNSTEAGAEIIENVKIAIASSDQVCVTLLLPEDPQSDALIVSLQLGDNKRSGVSVGSQ